MPRIFLKTKKDNSKSPPPPNSTLEVNTNKKNGIINDITSNIASGFTFGVGSSIARNMIDNMFQSSNKDYSKNKKEEVIFNEYLECLKNNDNNKDFCKEFQKID